MRANNQWFSVPQSSIVNGPSSIYIPGFIYRNILQSILHKQTAYKIRTLCFIERWRRNLLDLNGKLNHMIYQFAHLANQSLMITLRLRDFDLNSVSSRSVDSYTSLTISRNTFKRASAKPGITSSG